MKNSSFCHLHLHTDFSVLDGLGKASEYAERAKEMNFQYLGISDHGNLDNTINFQNECLKRDIIGIIGCELYLTSYDDFKGKSGHCCVFVKNEIGWRNLCEILSIANLDHFYRKPRIDFNILYDLCEGLCVSTACSGSWLKLKDGIPFFHKLHKKIGGDLYLEIMPHHLDVQDEVNAICLDLHKKTGVKLISTVDAHYVRKEDHLTHDVLLCIQTKTTMDNPNRFRFNFEGSFLQSCDEILENYATRGIIDEKTVKRSLFNTLEIAEKCKDFRIKKRDISLPDFRPYPQLSPKQNLKKLYTERAEKRLGFKLSDNKEYLDRARMEYEVITEKNFETYFLIVQDFLEWCRNQGWTPGPGRGCLTEETLVLTDTGYKYLPDINIGDYVVSHSGQYNKVLNKMEYSVDEDLLRISSFHGFEGDSMTKDHECLSVKMEFTNSYIHHQSRNNGKEFKDVKYKIFSNSDLSWNKAEDLSVGDLMFTPWIKNREIKDVLSIDLSKYFSEFNEEYCFYEIADTENRNITIRSISKKYNIDRNVIQRIQRGEKYREESFLKLKSALENEGTTVDEWLKIKEKKKIKIKRYIDVNEDFLRFLGRWIGDGWLIKVKSSQTYQKWGLCFSSFEYEEMEFYRNYINSMGFPFSEAFHKTKKLVQWHIYCSSFANFFHDLFPNYEQTSSTKYIPSIFKHLPDNKIKSLLIGLEEADGYIDSKQSRECIDTTSSTLRDDIKELLLYLKIPSTIKERKPFHRGKYLCNTSWKITFSGITLDKKNWLGLINKNTEGYYSIIHKIEKCHDTKVYDIEVENDNSYLTQNYIVHNSAAGCLLSYILGITEIDPIKHGLIFERFLNKERSGFPDIDIDIPKHRREEARQYLIDKYGKNNVAGVSTFSYLKGKSVIRDVSRVFGIPLEEVDIFAKSLEDKGEDLIKNAIEKTEEGRAFASKYPKIVEYAQRLEGTVRGCGQHASAVVVSKEDLTKSGQCNLSKRSGHIVVNLDMHDAEDSGLMKLDLLGLSQLSIVDETFKLIKETEGKEYNIRSFLDVDDQQVFKELSKGNTAGIFQMNTRTMTDYIKKLGISCFEDMSACVALVRPGASDSGIADEYLLRKHGKTWEPKHPIYDDITKETLGLVCIEGNSYIYTDKGPKKIKYISKNDSICCFDENEMATNKPCDGAEKTRFCDGVKLQLSSGQSCILTDDHEVSTNEGYIKVKDLDPKVHLIKIPKRIILKEDFIDIASWIGSDIDLAYLIGYLIGNGSLKGSPTLCCGPLHKCDLLLNWIQESFPLLTAKKYFHTRAWYIRLSTDELEGLPWPKNRTTKLRHFLDSNNLAARDKKKMIPDFIYSCPIDVKYSFIAGLIDSDGMVSYNTDRKRCLCVFTSTSKDVIRGLSILLNSVDIRFSVSEIRIHIYDTESLKFKIDRFLKLKNFKNDMKLSDGSSSRWETKNRIFEIINRDCLSQMEFSRGYDIGRGVFAEKCNLIRLRTYESIFGKKNIDSDYVKIESMKKVKNKTFYGMSVRDHHNLISNGICVKNCYQESTMSMFTRLAGLSFVIADNIRKIIGKKRDVREFDQYKDMFVNGCLKEKTFTKDEALQFWTELEASANYLFNKSHSVSYAFLSYVTAWLKIHYPSHFYCANLTMGEDDKKGSIIKEAYDYGLSIKLPKVGYSKASTWTVNDNILLAPFSEIKGLGEKQAIEASLEIPQKFKPFSGFYSTPERSKNETKIKKLLTTIGSWDYNEKPKLEVQELFEFPISNDLEVIGKTLLDLCKNKYSEEIIYKIFNGKKYPEIKLIQNVERDFYEFECNGCSLNGNPFETVFGDKNLMIITEHPSYSDANQNNKLFSCNVANEVLMDLYDIGVNYEDLTIACCTKCFPGKGRKPIDEQKNACAKHLEKEIFHAKPKIILALGRISVEFFNPEARASEFYGKFIWSERYKSFIFYGYSTGFAYIGQENKMKFKKSLKKFYEMVKRNL